jgi:hypothetical protein
MTAPEINLDLELSYYSIFRMINQKEKEKKRQALTIRKGIKQ